MKSQNDSLDIIDVILHNALKSKTFTIKLIKELHRILRFVFISTYNDILSLKQIT